MWLAKSIIILLIISSSSYIITAQPLFQTSFSKGAWNPDEWIQVKSPRWSYIGEWIQGESYIQNKTPEGATSEEMLGQKSSETYTSMLLDRKFSGSVSIKATMEFTDRMAPLIVFAPELGKDKDGYPEYREHFEVVLWDNGINIWHHYFNDDKTSYKLVAYWKFSLKPNTKYKLEVKFWKRKTDKMLSVLVDGREFGYMDNSLPDEFYAGITGCEGINHFYDFSVRK